MRNTPRVGLLKKLSFIAVSSLFALAFFIFADPALAADQWETITPAAASGYEYNIIEAAGDYLFLGTDHGLYRSSNRGVTWSAVNNGLTNTNIISLALGWIYDQNNGAYAVSGDSPVFIGTAAGIFRGTVAGSAWAPVSAGPTATAIYDIEIDQFEATQGYINYVYAATDQGVWRSDDSGASWVLDSAGMETAVIKLTSDFGNGVIYALTASNELYYSPLFSSYGFTSWQLAWPGAGATARDISMLNPAGYINWLATNQGILKSDETGENWTTRNIGLDGLNVKTVRSDFNDSNIAYAALSGYGIYRTTSGAILSPQWLPINMNLSDLNIRDVKTNPLDSLIVYAIGDSGVYKMVLSDIYIDLTPPGAVTDLALVSRDGSSAVISWTEPASDGDFGYWAEYYDIRYSTSLITEENWSNATPVSPQPSPWIPGKTTHYAINSLEADTSYYFALKTADGSANNPPRPLNWSVLSNVISSIVSAPDATIPVITIIEPTTNVTHYTSLTPINLSGTATDNIAVTSVTWSNNRGGSGTAVGTSAWSVANLALQSGINIITVTARDAADNSATDTLTVTYTPPTYSVGGSISGLSGSVVLSNNATDNLAWSSNGNFGFVTYLNNGATYAVTVVTQPYNQTCTVANGSGTIAGANITNIVVTCINNPDPIDITAPLITAFIIPASSASLTVAITTFNASDAVGVTGYRLTESLTKPLASADGWTATAPTSYLFATPGVKTLYAWARDAAGNVSDNLNDSVTITLPTYTVGGSISGLTGTVVLQNNANNNLSRSANGSFTFTTALNSGATYAVTVLTNPTGQTCTVTNGSGTIAGANITNVSVACLTNADTTAPLVTAFTIPATAASLTVTISTFTATDATGVTGYKLTETATVPLAAATDWTATAPTSYIFATPGVKTLYAWARDAAGNVSTSLNDSVTITLITAPTVTTSAAASITTTTATLNGSVATTGGANVSQHGFAYGTTATLATTIATTTGGSFTGTGAFTSTAARNLTGLNCATTYYFRAYATNSAGTGYGTITSLTTSACPSSAKAITAFNFNSLALAVIGVINETNHTISLTVPSGTSLTALVPTIVHSGASVSPASGLAGNFTNPVTYTVTAQNSSTQAYLVTVIVSTDITAPTVPTALTATAVSASQINLAWASSTDAIGVSGYQVFRGMTQIATSTVLSYSDTGLAASTAYSYTVAAFDAAGNISATTTAVSATTQPTPVVTPPPSGGGGGGGGGTPRDTLAPTNVSLVINNHATTTTSRTVTLTLSANDASTMQMMIANDPAFSAAVWENSTTTKSWLLSGDNGTKIVYIKFKDASGNTSNIVSDSIALVVPGLAEEPVAEPKVLGEKITDSFADFIKVQKTLVKKADPALTKRLAGKILLQVEDHGEAWYIDMTSQKRFYLADGAAAYGALHKFGLGITNKDLAKIPVGIETRFIDTDTDGDGLADKLEEGLGTDKNKVDSDGDGYNDGNEVINGYDPLGPGKLVYDANLVNRLKGRIVLQTESRGQAWYINPADGKRYYLKDGGAAYQIMRYLSLGITNANLRQINIGD